MARRWKSGCPGCRSRGRRGGGGQNGAGARILASELKSELGLAIESLHRRLKRGPRYVPLTPAAIKLVASIERKTCGNERLLGWSAIRCEGGGLLRVMHHRTALDYVTGRVTLPCDWMAEGQESLIAWEFN